MLCVLALATPLEADPSTGPEIVELTVATVQFEVAPEIYASVPRFTAEVDRIVERAVERYGADLVIFPEYVNMFLVAARYPQIATEAPSVAEAVRRIAARHDVTLIPGTTLVPVHNDGRRELRNRLVVIDEDGRVVYEQDKVYLTALEAGLLGIAPGTLGAATPLEIEGVTVGITVCRDTYFDTWHDRFRGVDLWVDLRANGEPYSRRVYERFLASLPERVAQTAATAGINASLTGAFLNHVWAGPSYVVEADGDRIAESAAPVGTQITAARLVGTAAGLEIEPIAPRR